MFNAMRHRIAGAGQLPLLMLLFAVLVLAGCASSSGSKSSSSSRYALSQDRAPAGNFDASGLQDASPRYEPARKAGNKSPYTVWGRSYTVMASADGYVERGVASWYGEKFHGHKTSNGETFDMYTMTAAHKSLPLPSYARVTNLDNGRSVIVRVNDRGPFHGDRLIDLSYAAAKKLGYQSRGTARVEVAAITVRPDGSMTLAGKPFSPGGNATVPVVAPSRDRGEALFVQLGSFSVRDSATGLLARARNHASRDVRIRRVDSAAGEFHRVQVGPFENAAEARNELQMLEARGFGPARVLTDQL